MDDFKIANNESIKKLNEEYKKLQFDSKNIKQLNITYTEDESKILFEIIKNLTLEKNLVFYYNKQNEPLNECINIFKDIFLLVDELSFNIETPNFDNYKHGSFRDIFTYNFLVTKNINSLINHKPEIACTLKEIKFRQIELVLILIPFCIF